MTSRGTLTSTVRSKGTGSSVEFVAVNCKTLVGKGSGGEGRGRDISQTQTSPDFRPQWFASLRLALFNSMLLWACSVMNQRCHQNVVSTKEGIQGAAESVTNDM